MAYTRKNYLLKVKAVCELYEQMHKPDVPMVRTYRNVIYPCFYISLCTFQRYLNTNYKKELRELGEQQQPVNPKQYTLF
ncbi:MAG: hypothetical protein E6Q66_07485 [Pedobacter sp.]|nr:MAG: hypothetical protein E6Q66_07485 [Pedobacter sp.]